MSSMLTAARFETSAWLLICGALAAGIGVETDWGRRLQPSSIVQPAAKSEFAKPVLAQPFELAPADAFLETAIRPLFVVSRRPAPPTPPPEPPKPAMKKDQFVLTGVTMVPEGKFAFLLEKAVNRARMVPEGKEINGIKVKQILPDQVVLTQFDDTEVLTLKTAKGGATPTGPVFTPSRNDPSGQPDQAVTVPPSSSTQDVPPRQTPASSTGKIPAPTPGLSLGPAPASNPTKAGTGSIPR